MADIGEWYVDPAGSDVSTTLNGAIDNSQTTIAVTSAAGFSPGDYFVVGDGTNSEIILIGGISVNDFTGCTRAAAGSTAQAFGNGSPVTFGGVWANPFATIKKAMLNNSVNLLSGDEIFVAPGRYMETSIAPSVAGTVGGPWNVLRGDTDNSQVDGLGGNNGSVGDVIVDASGATGPSLTTEAFFGSTANWDGWQFRNILSTGGRYGWIIDGASASNNITCEWYDCLLEGFGSDVAGNSAGILFQTLTNDGVDPFKFYRCYIINSGHQSEGGDSGSIFAIISKSGSYTANPQIILFDSVCESVEGAAIFLLSASSRRMYVEANNCTLNVGGDAGVVVRADDTSFGKMDLTRCLLIGDTGSAVDAASTAVNCFGYVGSDGTEALSDHPDVPLFRTRSFVYADSTIVGAASSPYGRGDAGGGVTYDVHGNSGSANWSDDIGAEEVTANMRPKYAVENGVLKADDTTIGGAAGNRGIKTGGQV